MLEDRVLIWKFKCGSGDALRRIYQKYKKDLLRLAISLLTESNAAEDVVHDVFASFIRDAGQFRFTRSLKGYLATCVANKARNANRAYRRQHASGPDEAPPPASHSSRPDRWIICSDELKRLNDALAKLPYDQREAVVLRAQLGMKFGQDCLSLRAARRSGKKVIFSYTKTIGVNVIIVIGSVARIEQGKYR